MARVPLGSAFIAVAALVFALAGQGHLATAADGKVHLIAAYDSSEEANLGGDVVADARSILGAFRDNIPSDRLKVQTISGKKLDRASIFSAINHLQVERREDSVVFFFTGHGAFDKDRGHFFSLPHSREEVLRRDVEAAIVDKKPRTGVLITDCCEAGAKYSGPLAVRAAQGPQGANRHQPPLPPPVLRPHGLMEHHVVQARGGLHHPG